MLTSWPAIKLMTATQEWKADYFKVRDVACHIGTSVLKFGRTAGEQLEDSKMEKWWNCSRM